MSIIRTDEQADAQEILKLVIETANFYRVMGELLSEENINPPLFEIAQERETYIAPLQGLVKALGELPETPDSDKELLDELGGKLTQLLSDDFQNAVFDRCLRKDELLADVIDNKALSEQSTEFKNLLGSLNDHLAETRKRINN